FLHEERIAAERAVGLKPIDIQPVLALERNKHKGRARMKIEMAGPEAENVAWCDRSELRQQPILEAENFQGAGILRIASGGLVSTRDQDRRAIGRSRPDLMGVDAGVRFDGLIDQRAQRAVLIDAMHGDVAWII